ncbi:MAG: 1-acyl-sn-glycerol-3-phosphate acyltransferase [Verrucomicrobia subdivision 3 bacterium]|nr:1-acyl-sn-glycerol-3-phosphate acyltransferase [Limisphaerales bacterium]MCS1412778.1 1-acyl-sn-glycerol-3-phosphate acyltransferase [Limisphaerales bacterium]
MKIPYRICWWLLRFFFLVYFRWRVVGADRIPEVGAVILASNHASYLDPPLIGSAASREFYYLARKSLFRFPVMGRVLRAMNALPVDRAGRSPKGLKAILDCLASGEPVVLFPEGTRTNDGEFQAARSGVGLATVKSGAPVIPVRIYGSYQAYNRRMWLPLPRQVTVVFGQPLRFDAEIAEIQTSSKQQIRELYAKVADKIMKGIAALEIDGSSTVSGQS